MLHVKNSKEVDSFFQQLFMWTSLNFLIQISKNNTFSAFLSINKSFDQFKTFSWSFIHLTFFYQWCMLWNKILMIESIYTALLMSSQSAYIWLLPRQTIHVIIDTCPRGTETLSHSDSFNFTVYSQVLLNPVTVGW